MIKYANIIDKKTGLCEVGLGTNSEFYESIGMTQQDVEQSEIDNQWYLSDKCPHKSEEEKKEEEKQARILEIKNLLNEVDLKSIRAIRSNDKEYLEKYEKEAQELREELHKLEQETK